ncbi:MAG: hypothetical protein KGJ86_07270 [Chloroflexota bacterium]|nr:hypothetical protein [Chloroflexota bacterium]
MSAPVPGNSNNDSLRAAVRGAPRVHLLLWQDYAEDADHHLQGWLDGHLEQIAGHNWREITVYDYSPGSVFAATPPAGLVLSNADFSGQLRLLGYTERRLAVGPGLRVALVWRRLAPVTRAFHVFVHLVDRDGHSLANADHRPAFDMLDLRSWDGGRLLVDPCELAASGGVPDHLELGLYDPADGFRLQPASLRLPYRPH